MGKFLNKFKGINIKGTAKQIAQKADDYYSEKQDKEREYDDVSYADNEDFNDDKSFSDDYYDEVGTPQAQKPESFHHFILENQYKDLERSIRGFKDIWKKETQEWVTVRKKEHCFTDEEAEEILRTAQSHLATDIKLSWINKESFPILMDTIYQEVAFLFESIAEYRYGRYGSYENQYNMKLQNFKIFLELFTRIQANYSRAIAGSENKLTHSSVRGQESLQNNDDFSYDNRRYS